MESQTTDTAPTTEVPAALVKLDWPWLVRISWHVDPGILGHPTRTFEPARTEDEAVDRAVLARDRCGSRMAPIRVVRVEVRELHGGTWRTVA